MWPFSVYQARPPSNSCSHVIGWSAPIAQSRGAYVVSSTVTSTRTPFVRGFASQPYHSSVRVQRAGSAAVDASRGASTSIVAAWISGCPDDHAPTSWPYQGQPRSVSAAECTPT